MPYYPYDFQLSTARYDFDKSALVVTVNRCVNLPAKDAANRSRYPIQMLHEVERYRKTCISVFRHLASAKSRIKKNPAFTHRYSISTSHLFHSAAREHPIHSMALDPCIE